MAAIRKILKGILKLLKGRFDDINSQTENIVTPAHNEAEIKKILADFLPPSLGVGSGTVINREGNTSKPINIIVYHKYNKESPQTLQGYGKNYLLSQVVFIIEVNLTYNEDSLAEALDNIKSVKILKQTQNLEFKDDSIKNKNIKPNPELPVSIICFYKTASKDKLTETETFFCSLKTQIERYKVSHRPDYLFSLAHSASYINPALRVESPDKYDIGLSLEPELNKPIPCYICNKKFTQRHFFYPRLCLQCGDFNYTKRKQTANLEKLTALVTGARVKVGYEVALKLLRDGARVIATTRFPHDAAKRYSKEPDFDKWCDRLHIYGVDFRHIPSVEYFIEHVNTLYNRLDIIINNAAQTIRRPPAFYAHLIAFESLTISELPREIQPLLFAYIPTNKRILPNAAESVTSVTSLSTLPVTSSIQGISLGMNLSAALSQVPLMPEDHQHDVNLFPPGIYDADQQQIDKRTHNSWRMKLDEVSTTELLEVYLINAIVPFMLSSKLKHLMMQSPSPSKYIINVTAMEGIFNYINKQSRHPHTNMAKAALNMMTRTSARDYAQDNIFMNSVDTGWITNENPYPIALKMAAQGFQPPLDAKDAAARICDPIYVGLNSGKNEYGKFLKNYLVCEW